MRQEYTDKDDLPNDLLELEKLRMHLSDSLLILQSKIKTYSSKLGETYNQALNDRGGKCYAANGELLMMSSLNDSMLNEFSDLDQTMARVEFKIRYMKKVMEDI